MADGNGTKISYFIVGLGIGALVGIFFAPKSGEETRDYLSQRAEEGKEYAQRKGRELRERAEEGKEYAQRKARELRERAEDFVEHGKHVAARQKESISAAVEAGRDAYQREKTKEI